MVVVGAVVRRYKGHTGHVLALYPHTESQKFVSGGQDRKALFWDVRMSVPVHTYCSEGGKGKGGAQILRWGRGSDITVGLGLRHQDGAWAQILWWARGSKMTVGLGLKHYGGAGAQTLRWARGSDIVVGQGLRCDGGAKSLILH